MDGEEVKRIFAEVKANSAKLEACPGPHDFKPSEWWKGPNSPVRRYTCMKCGGTADAVAVSWYLKGLKHGAMPQPSSTS